MWFLNFKRGPLITKIVLFYFYMRRWPIFIRIHRFIVMHLLKVIIWLLIILEPRIISILIEKLFILVIGKSSLIWRSIILICILLILGVYLHWQIVILILFVMLCWEGWGWTQCLLRFIETSLAFWSYLVYLICFIHLIKLIISILYLFKM